MSGLTLNSHFFRKPNVCVRSSCGVNETTVIPDSNRNYPLKLTIHVKEEAKSFSFQTKVSESFFLSFSIYFIPVMQ